MPHQPPLVFMMGRSPVFLPTDLRYARQHMWIDAKTGPVRRFGFTTYAVKLIGDPIALRWKVNVGDPITAGKPIGHIEGSKAVSDLFAPVDGTLEAINDEVLKDLNKIQWNPYEAWLLSVRTSESEVGEQTPVFSAEEYQIHLEAVWPLTERLLKGRKGE
jgi:glycine cleavage system H protein